MSRTQLCMKEKLAELYCSLTVVRMKFICTIHTIGVCMFELGKNKSTDKAMSPAASTQPVRVRFAPSPTGSLHIGGARTAIYNWAFARRNNGTFILRIEDTDPERSTAENTAQIMRSLRWLGLDWDEGPEVGGAYGPYLQTERFATYGAALEQLKKRDVVYPCFCTQDELARKRDEGLSAKSYSGYDRTCRRLSPCDVQGRIDVGVPHTWRLKIPLDRGDVSFDDLVFGTTTVPISQLDDFILLRSDGTPTYNYAVCVDDVLMKISHVIRGDDHMSNTPKQILVYEALGAPVPQFAHLSMILGSDGKRLSKRHGATSVEAYRDEGFLSEALLNYLSLLGWSLDGQTTIIDTDMLCSSFSLDRVSRNPAIFDAAKLAWVNQVYLKEMGEKTFVDALEPFLVRYGMVRGRSFTLDDEGAVVFGDAAPTEAVHADISGHRAWYESLYGLVVERAKTLTDVILMIPYLFAGDMVMLDEKSVDTCLRIDGAPQILRCAIASLQNPDLPWEHEHIESALRRIPEQCSLKPKLVFQAVRVAVCGNMVSPPLFESLELIGREHVVARLRYALTLVG